MARMSGFLSILALSLALAALPAAAHPGHGADARGDRIEARLDARGDRIEWRSDRRADWLAAQGRPRAAALADARGEFIDARLDARGRRIDRRLDARAFRRHALARD
jgi:hypothetical protein